MDKDKLKKDDLVKLTADKLYTGFVASKMDQFTDYQKDAIRLQCLEFAKDLVEMTDAKKLQVADVLRRWLRINKDTQLSLTGMEELINQLRTLPDEPEVDLSTAANSEPTVSEIYDKGENVEEPQEPSDSDEEQVGTEEEPLSPTLETPEIKQTATATVTEVTNKDDDFIEINDADFDVPMELSEDAGDDNDSIDTAQSVDDAQASEPNSETAPKDVTEDKKPKKELNPTAQKAQAFISQLHAQFSHIPHEQRKSVVARTGWILAQHELDIEPYTQYTDPDELVSAIKSALGDDIYDKKKRNVAKTKDLAKTPTSANEPDEQADLPVDPEPTESQEAAVAGENNADGSGTSTAQRQVKAGEYCKILCAHFKNLGTPITTGVGSRTAWALVKANANVQDFLEYTTVADLEQAVISKFGEKAYKQKPTKLEDLSYDQLTEVQKQRLAASQIANKLRAQCTTETDKPNMGIMLKYAWLILKHNLNVDDFSSYTTVSEIENALNSLS